MGVRTNLWEGRVKDDSQVSGLGDSVEDGLTKLSWHMQEGKKRAWSGGNDFTFGYAELEVWNIQVVISRKNLV